MKMEETIEQYIGKENRNEYIAGAVMFFTISIVLILIYKFGGSVNGIDQRIFLANTTTAFIIGLVSAAIGGIMLLLAWDQDTVGLVYRVKAVWKRHRKKIPPEVKKRMEELRAKAKILKKPLGRPGSPTDRDDHGAIAAEAELHCLERKWFGKVKTHIKVRVGF